VSDDEVNLFIERSISEMLAAGSCVVERLGGRAIVIATGECFWNLAHAPDDQADRNGQPASF